MLHVYGIAEKVSLTFACRRIRRVVRTQKWFWESFGYVEDREVSTSGT
jgi:uncharacterized membrane protein YdbT with pleckstrin-like domain